MFCVITKSSVDAATEITIKDGLLQSMAELDMKIIKVTAGRLNPAFFIAVSLPLED